MEGGRLRSDLIHFDSALQMSPHPTIFQGLGRWFVGAGGYGNKVSRYLMPVPTISEGGPISVEADNWGLFPKVEEGSHVDLLVGEQKFRIEIPPLGQEGVFKIDGESDVQLPLFRSFTFRSAEPTEPGVVLEAPAIKVSPLGRIISLPFGIALHAHSRMDATRSLIS